MKNKFIEMYVKDTGIGISPDNIDVIFKRFSQEDKELSRKAGGLGLGLSIAKENAELLGGSIWLKSKKDEGTTFYVSIPYDPVTIPGYNADPIVPDSLTKKPKDKLRILVVEDEEINYLYIEEVLNDSKEFKVDIIHARNGQEAVDICTEDKNISIVLMDVKMPVMNGYEATRKIKAIRPGLPVIAQTAYTAPKDREEALSQGCDEFITKPIDDGRLIKLISDLAIV